MSEGKLVTVIMPVYNRFQWADDAINSVYAQSYRPIELIVIDDCSEVPYSSKITTDKDFRLCIIRHTQNQGPGASRETGRQIAQGDYIAYMDSDDLWHKDKLKSQIALLSENPEAGMCYCKSLGFLDIPITGLEPVRKLSDQTFSKILPQLLYERPWDTSACTWTRWATDKIGAWTPARTWEDKDYEFRAGCYDVPILHINKPLCFTRKATPQELMNVQWKTVKINQVVSLVSMHQAFQKSNKIELNSYRKKMQSIFIKHGSQLLDYREVVLGEKCLTMAKTISQRDYILNLFLSFLLKMISFGYVRLSTKVGRSFYRLYFEK